MWLSSLQSIASHVLCRNGLVEMNSFRLFMPREVFLSPSTKAEVCDSPHPTMLWLPDCVQTGYCVHHLFIYFMLCLWVFFPDICLCNMCGASCPQKVTEGQKRALDPLPGTVKLELQRLSHRCWEVNAGPLGASLTTGPSLKPYFVNFKLAFVFVLPSWCSYL